MTDVQEAMARLERLSKGSAPTEVYPIRSVDPMTMCGETVFDPLALAGDLRLILALPQGEAGWRQDLQIMRDEFAVYRDKASAKVDMERWGPRVHLLDEVLESTAPPDPARVSVDPTELLNCARYVQDAKTVGEGSDRGRELARLVLALLSTGGA